MATRGMQVAVATASPLRSTTMPNDRSRNPTLAGPTTPAGTPRRLAWSTWTLFVASLPVLILHALGYGPWRLAGWLTLDGLTVLMWPVVTLFSALVQTFALRHLAGDPGQERFVWHVIGFTLAVMLLVAADHVALFLVAWILMGAMMARLIGHTRQRPQARAAARLSGRYFLASGGLLAAVVAGLAWSTGQATISGILSATGQLPAWLALAAGGGLVAAAAIQSALFPFHTWLLTSMTAPTPASALMHAGFVNAGGILLLRWAPVLTLDPTILLAALALGALSALAGKLLKGVQADIKGQLGCSTIGQMGFMTLQAGLGFFAAAITHLVLHGFYKAYEFLSAGSRLARTAPGDQPSKPPLPTATQTIAATIAGLAGGTVFALMTGKGTSLDSGLVLTVFVTMTVVHAVQRSLRRTELEARRRYVILPLLLLPAMALYAGIYLAVKGLLASVPMATAPTAITPLHLAIIGAFLATYLLIETGVHERSHRLYVALMNATQPPTDSLFHTEEDTP